MQVRKQQLELDMEQQTGSKKEKEYVKAVYCHHAYLTSMQSASAKLLQSCPTLTVASLPAYRFLRRQVRWSSIPIS